MRSAGAVAVAASVGLAGCTLPGSDDPVFLVLGLDAFDGSGGDYSGLDAFISALAARGWDADHTWTIGHYECDENTRLSSADFGRGDDPHAHHAPHGVAQEHRGEACEPVGGHDRDTSIEHVAYHWAWAAAFVSGDRCGHYVGHSMGGLIVRYAFARVGAGDPDFPALCARTVVTFGTPHAGSGLAWACIERQCLQLRHGSAFLRALDVAPAGGDVGTQTLWIAAGSVDDTVVSPPSQLAMPADLRLLYDVPFADTPLVHGHYFDARPAADSATAVYGVGQGPVRTAATLAWPADLLDRLFRTGTAWLPTGAVTLGGPDVEDAQPAARDLALAPDRRTVFEVECSEDPDGDEVYVRWRVDRVTWDIERDLAGSSPDLSTTFAAGMHTVEATCMDAFGGEAVEWQITAS
jgi:hypothetical protein